VGASSPAQLGYAGVFYQDMKQLQPNLTYKNLAIPGETTASFLSRGSNKSQLDRALAEIDAAKAAGKRVSPITLTIGGNDVLAARNSSAAQKQTTIDSFDTNFKKILGQLAAHTDIGNTTDLIVTTYYNPFATSPGAQSQDELAWIQRFNDLIKQRASEYKARVADFYTPVLGHELEYTWISNGDIHPNVAGHAVLGGALWQMSGYTKEQS
jgi:lysophospholipase L1-like esterase